MGTSADAPPARWVLLAPSTRGVITGAVITALGLWSVLVPLVGPYFGYALSPVGPWTMPWAALGLQIVPGGVLLLAGILLILTQRRLAGLAAGTLAAAAGLWLAVGSALWFSTPAWVLLGGVATGGGASTAEQIGMASGLGAVVTLLAGVAVGRFSVCGARDVAAAREQGTGAWPSGPEPDPAIHTGSADRAPGSDGADSAVPAQRGTTAPGEGPRQSNTYEVTSPRSARAIQNGSK